MSVPRVVGFWAQHFGVPAAAFAVPGLRVVPHAGLAGWNGVWAFQRDETWIVSAPPGRVEALRARPVACDRLLEPAVLRDWLEAPGALAIGPAWWGRLDGSAPLRAEADCVRRLAVSDHEALGRFRDEAGEADWGTSGLELDGMPIFGASVAGRLAALVGCRLRGATAADLCLLTHPTQRGRGLAAEAARAACRFLRDSNRLVLYQTLLANEPAVAVALRLGFEHDATHLAMRLEAT